MKGFISDFEKAAIVVFIAFLSIFIMGRNYVQESNNLYKQRYIEQHGAEIKTLILGHSQAANGINPWVMGDSVFNMAELSRILYYDKEILKRNIALMPNQKIVIYPMLYQIDNGAFFENESFREFSINDYKKNMGINPPAEFDDNSPYRPRIFDVLNYHYYVSTRDCDSLGYLTLGDSSSDAIDFINTEVNEDNIVTMLCTMARVCNMHGVRFIVLSMPCNNTFNKQSVDSMGLVRVERIIDSVKEKYPVEYGNYLNHPDFRSDGLFQRQTHLNHKGATLFALRIKKDFNL